MSTKNLYLLHFNNYFDRKIKKYSTLSEYQTNASYKTFSNINFIYGNGVETTQIFNIKNKEESESQHYNYCLVVDKEDKIESRWFVLEQIRNSAGQYTISLKRDLISDFWDDIYKSKFYMEKSSFDPWTYHAIYYDSDSIGTAMFNEEPVNMNLQPYKKTDISQSEFNWLTAFIPKTGTGASGTIAAHKYDNINLSGTLTEDEMNILDVASYGITTSSKAYLYISPMTRGVLFDTTFTDLYEVELKFNGSYSGKAVSKAYGSYHYNGVFDSNRLVYNSIFDTEDTPLIMGSYTVSAGDSASLATKIAANSKSYGSLILSAAQDYNNYNAIKNIINKYNHKIVKKPNDNKCYKLNITYEVKTSINKVDNISATNIYNLIKNTDSDFNIGFCNNWVTEDEKYYYTFTFEELSTVADYLVIPETRQHTIDLPYDIITFPYHKSSNFTFNGKTIINQNQLSFVNNFANPDGTDDYITAYDVIITPYCPLNNLTLDGKTITAVGLVDGADYSTSTVGALVFYCPYNTSDFTFDYTAGAIWQDNGKISYLSRKFEIVSPDNSQSSPLLLYENNEDGNITLNIKQTLLPYNSRLQVLPEYRNYNGYYNDNSNRGLIYSLTRLTQMSNSWVSYVNENSNYQKLFDAQISYSEEQNKISNQKAYNNIALSEKNALMSAATGLVNVGVSAASGNAGKAIAGALSTTTGVASNAMSIQNAYANQALTEKAQQSAIQYTKDNFYLQMESIQNRSSTISTVGGLFNGYNYCPYILYYKSVLTLRDNGNNVIKKYFDMNGFTYNIPFNIPKYGINNKCDTYVKGFIYRFTDDIDADANLCTAINNELKAGVYV